MQRLIYIIIFLIGYLNTNAQTCCSGGVPLTGNLGFVGEQKGQIQLELSYDYNHLDHIYIENLKSDDQSRIRTTQSLLLKFGYNILDDLSVDLLFSFVQQEREINQFGSIDYVRTRGIADAILLIKYQLPYISNLNQNVLIGVGPKFPMGRSDLKNESGIALNADLQPGSGSFDFLYWLHYQRKLKLRPSTSLYSRVIYKQNGINTNYFNNQEYKFGNELLFMAGIGDQLNLKFTIINVGLSFKYRNTHYDEINGQELSNTGGNWIYVMPNMGIFLTNKFAINFSPELPLYTKVTGTQLSTTYRLNVGIFLNLQQNNNLKINDL